MYPSPLHHSKGDLLFGYIKANYKSFSYSNLITSVSKIENENLLLQLENELILRTMLSEDNFITIQPNQLEQFVTILCTSLLPYSP